MAGLTLREAALGRAEDVGGTAARDRAEQAFARLDLWFSRFQLLRTTVAATFIVAAVAAALPAIGVATHEGSHEFWFGKSAPVLAGVSGGLLLAAFCCHAAWPAARLLAEGNRLPARLKDADLEPFHHIRRSAATGSIDVIDHAGNAIPADAFRSPWSLALFSAEAGHRQLLRKRAADVMDGQLLVRAPAMPDPVAVELPELRQHLAALNVQIANVPARSEHEALTAVLVQRIDELDTKLATLAAPAAAKATAPRQPPKRHWMADVDEAHFKAFLPTLLATWDGPKYEQVRLALQTAFETTRADQRPTIRLVDLVDVIVAALVRQKLPVGLDLKGNSSSTEWISQMFGNRLKHHYLDVRLMLTKQLPIPNTAALPAPPHQQLGKHNRDKAERPVP